MYFLNNTISGFTSNVIYLDDYRATGADTSGRLGACDGTLTQYFGTEMLSVLMALYMKKPMGMVHALLGVIRILAGRVMGNLVLGQEQSERIGATSLANEPFYAWGINGATILYPWSSGLAHYINS